MQQPRAGRRELFRSLVFLIVAFASTLSTASAQQAAWRFDDVDRVVAISDVHGDYDAMVATLAGAGVIDAKGNWSGGTSHLVITGDLLDRGPDSRPVMDLLMRLEGEAAAAGGAVHQLVGNHEVMNLVGDLRYVAAEEFAAFAADEDPDERAEWYRRFRAARSLEPDEDALRAEFDERYPPGFFGHRQAFGSDGVYGQWLMQQPALVIVNDTAFVHGGLSPAVAGLGLEGVNDGLLGEVRAYVDALEALIDAGLMDPAENFYRHASVLESVDAASLPPDVATAVETVIRLNGSDIHGPESPLWYRGNVGCAAPIEDDRLSAVLDAIGARRVVIGHTPTFTHQVLSRLDGKVIEIDTGMLSDYYGGSGHALVLEGSEVRVITEAGVAEPVVVHPRRVGLRDADIGADELARILATGRVAAAGEADGGRRPVTVTEGETVIDAVFIENPRSKGFVPELAAYALDRFLDLDMVPVTVARALDGDDGVLQFVPRATVDETRRRETGRGGSAWCPLPEQWAAMYVFDALIGNPGRPQAHILYSQDNWQLMLTGHDASFDSSRSLPPYLRDVDLAIGNYWQQHLRALTDTDVDERFADTLDRRRRRGLNSRRDLLLEKAGASE